MVGDSQIGKTSLMVKYVEGSFDEDYIQTLGVNFMEKTISLRNHQITFSIWDLGDEEKQVITKQARRFAKAMKASLIFCSTSHSINIHKIFKIVLSKALDIKCTIPEIDEVGAPILEYINT
ncbi:6090_t:CDS:2 [Entrophospora sp. SA101]|nr:6090_t:CDS:2 [Entrophospora sp. SA101]